MSEKIAVGCYFDRAQYLALTRIAARKSEATGQNVQAHHLIEDLVLRALTGPTRAPAKPKAERGPRRHIDRDEVRRLHADGMTDEAIAEAMGFSRSAIGHVRHGELKLPSLRPATRTSQLDHDELISLHAQGLNDRQIGERMGVSGSLICDHRNRLNLPKNGKQGRPKKNQETAA